MQKFKGIFRSTESPALISGDISILVSPANLQNLQAGQGSGTPGDNVTINIDYKGVSLLRKSLVFGVSSGKLICMDSKYKGVTFFLQPSSETGVMTGTYKLTSPPDSGTFKASAAK